MISQEMQTKQNWQLFCKSSNRAGGKHVLKTALRLKYHGICIWKFYGEMYMRTDRHIHTAYFWKTCKKSYYNGIVSYLKHMGRSRILEGSNSGRFSIGRWGTCRAIQSGKQLWQATVWLFQLPSPSRCCYGTRIVSEGFNRTQSVRWKNKIENHSLSGIHIFPATQATRPVAKKHRFHSCCLINT